MILKQEIVENILNDIEKTKEEGCKALGKKFDKYDGEIIISKEKKRRNKKKFRSKN